jgi:hypothetical protein
MKLDDRDKGRLLVLAVITLLALPTIWLINRDRDDSRPNVAAVGIDPGSQDAATPPTTFDPMGPGGDGYLEQVTIATTAATVAISHGDGSETTLGQAIATYTTSHNLGPSLCRYNGISGGQVVTVVNVANGRSIRCTTRIWPGGDHDTLVMRDTKFQQIADLTSAPIHVEIRQSS